MNNRNLRSWERSYIKMWKHSCEFQSLHIWVSPLFLCALACNFFSLRKLIEFFVLNEIFWNEYKLILVVQGRRGKKGKESPSWSCFLCVLVKNWDFYSLHIYPMVFCILFEQCSLVTFTHAWKFMCNLTRDWWECIFLVVPILTLDEINDINGTVHAGAVNSKQSLLFQRQEKK